MMRLLGYKWHEILGVLLLFFGILAVTLAIFITPTFATNHLSPDHNITPDGIKKLNSYRLALSTGGMLSVLSGLFLMKVKIIIEKLHHITSDGIKKLNNYGLALSTGGILSGRTGSFLMKAKTLIGKFHILILLAPIVIVILTFIGTDFFFDNQYDDGYITYRYAINLARGNGLVFNLGERADAASSFSYTVLLALLYKVGFTNLELVGGWIGLLSLAAIVWLVYKIAIAIAGDEYLALFLAFSCGLNGFLSGWALSGMDTLLWAAIILASVYLMVIDAKPAFIFIAVTLAVFTRFEGVFLVGALVLHLYNRQSTYKDWLVVFIILAVFSTFYVVKYEYYGVWISHAFWMKKVTPYYQSNPLELIRYWVLYGSVPLIFGFIGLLQNRKYLSILAFTLLSSLSVLFGPKSDWARYSVHLLPILCAFSARGYQFLKVKFFNIKSWKSNWILLTGSVIFVFIMLLQAATGIDFNRSNMIGFTGHQKCRKQLGSYIETFIPRDEIIASGDIGAIAYMAINHRFVDLHGLTSSEILSEYAKGNTVDNILTKYEVNYWADTFLPEAEVIGDVEFSCSEGGLLFDLVNIKR